MDKVCASQNKSDVESNTLQPHRYVLLAESGENMRR